MKENGYKISSERTIETIDILYHFLSCGSPFFILHLPAPSG